MTRLRLLWTFVRDSLWFVPMLGVLLAVLLAIGLVAWEATSGWAARLAHNPILGMGVEGARGVLGAIAGGLITVTGVIFSLTIVALQLASSQLSPRVMRTFQRDRANQMVLAIFIGTFTYTLLVMRSIRSAEENGASFVPTVAVLLAMVLLLLSVGALVYFVHHLARSIQVTVVIDNETRWALQHVPALYPQQIGEPVAHETIESVIPDSRPATVRAERAGYFQALDGERLLAAVGGEAMVLRVEPRLGDFVLRGEPLASLWPSETVGVARAAAVRGAFLLGPERTPEQDVEYGIIGISDIAVKALSPGINDPTTAILCIQRLGELLLALGRREMPARVRTDALGHARIVVPGADLSRATGLATRQITHYGASNPDVVRTLIEMLARVGLLLPVERRESVLDALERVLHSARDALTLPDDRRTVEREGAAALTRLQVHPVSASGSPPVPLTAAGRGGMDGAAAPTLERADDVDDPAAGVRRLRTDPSHRAGAADRARAGGDRSRG